MSFSTKAASHMIMGRWVERRVARLHGRLVIVIVRWGRVVGKLM